MRRMASIAAALLMFGVFSTAVVSVAVGDGAKPGPGAGRPAAVPSELQSAVRMNA